MRANWEADWRDKTSGTFCYQIQSRISYSVVRFHWGSRHLNSSSDGLYSIQPDKLTNRESSQTPAPMEDGRSPASRNREHIQSEHVQTPPSRCYLQRAPLQCSTSLPEWSRGIRCYRWKIFRSIFQEGVNRREERKREREREREREISPKDWLWADLYIQISLLSKSIKILLTSISGGERASPMSLSEEPATFRSIRIWPISSQWPDRKNNRSTIDGISSDRALIECARVDAIKSPRHDAGFFKIKNPRVDQQQAARKNYR